MAQFNARAVKALARGRWDYIFAALAPALSKALEIPGRHVPCPVHGGSDGFRLFKDFREKGGSICNSCGAHTDGFQTLMWVNGWTFSHAVTRVGELIAPADSSLSRVEVKPVGQKSVGTLLSAQLEKYGDRAPVFTVRLRAESGRGILRGKALERVLKDSSASIGDRVEINLVADEVFLGKDGKEWTRHLWTCKRLESAEEARAREAKELADAHAQEQYIKSLWMQAKPISKFDPVRRYLKRRGFAQLSPQAVGNIRYCRVMIGKKSFPIMLSAIRDINGNLVTLHQTFLTEDGRKANIETPKRIVKLPMGKTINGCGIKLGPDDASNVLCCAEGIETALSVSIATGYPCWSMVSATGLKSIVVPPSVKIVLIFADKDVSRTGQDAAIALQDRLAKEGRLAVVLLPTGSIPKGKKGIDWNDVFVAGERFPLVRPMQKGG